MATTYPASSSTQWDSHGAGHPVEAVAGLPAAAELQPELQPELPEKR